MKIFNGILLGLFAGLALVAKYFKNRADRLRDASLERDAREKEAVEAMTRRLQEARQARANQPPPDPVNRNDFQ
jgi:hypothetical protein